MLHRLGGHHSYFAAFAGWPARCRAYSGGKAAGARAGGAVTPHPIHWQAAMWILGVVTAADVVR